MAARPILFSGPMVRALLEGRKSQTRRAVKPQPPMGCEYVMNGGGEKALCVAPGHPIQPWSVPPRTNSADTFVRCPYGRPGGLLWVRETWAAPHNCDHLKPREISGDPRIHYAATDDRGGLLWRPSIHMPRWASRLTMRITGVRVERLQDISEEDARAEGVTPTIPIYGDCGGFKHEGGRDAFIKLWESIHGPGSWDANPWVWALSFSAIPKNIDEVK